MVVGTPSGETDPVETPPARTSLVGSAPPGDSVPQVGSTPPSDTAPPGDPVPPASEPTTEPAPRPDPVTPTDSGTAPPVEPAPTPEPAPQPAPPVGPVLASESVLPEENEPHEPLSWRTEEVPATSGPIVPASGQEGPHHLSSLGSAVSNAVETLGNAANTLGNLVDRSPFRSAGDEDSIGAVLNSLFSEGEVDLAPVGRHAEDPGSPSGGTGGASKDTPQPSSPFTPPAGSSFFSSLSGGGQAGPGGVAPLFLSVLVLGLILLRRDGKLLKAFCELPKPSSVLLLPLERPG